MSKHLIAQRDELIERKVAQMMREISIVPKFKLGKIWYSTVVYRDNGVGSITYQPIEAPLPETPYHYSTQVTVDEPTIDGGWVACFEGALQAIVYANATALYEQWAESQSVGK
jgi:hypothetical protein